MLAPRRPRFCALLVLAASLAATAFAPPAALAQVSAPASTLLAPPTALRLSALRAALAYGGAPEEPPHFSAALPPRADPWLGFDKAQHLVVSALLTLSVQYVLTDKARRSQRGALPLSAASAGAVGLGKELYDRHYSPSQYFSRRDLVADAVGIALGVGVILL